MGQPHDAFLKRMFSFQIFAAQFIQYFFSDLSKSIEISEIQMSTEEWVNEFLKKKSADIILKSSLKDSSGSIYFLIEAQANMRPDIGIKINRYVNGMHRAHFEAHKEKSFNNQILPIVINHSAQVWNPPTSVKRLHPLCSSLSHRSFEYIDLKQLNEDRLQAYPHLCAVLGVMRDVASFETQGLSNTTWAALQVLELTEQDDIMTSIICYLEEVIPLEQHSQLHHLLQAYLKKGDSLMKSIADMYIEEGIQRGEQRGVQLGEQRGIKLGIARTKHWLLSRLIQRGMSASEAAQLVLLDQEELFDSSEEVH